MKCIKVTGCHDCDKATHCGGTHSTCRKIDYKDNKNDVWRYVYSKTFHPECPLDDYEKDITALDIMGMKNILFKMSRGVKSGQFDSRSFVGDIALELRSLLFENENLFWKEYDEWELKQK